MIEAAFTASADQILKFLLDSPIQRTSRRLLSLCLLPFCFCLIVLVAQILDFAT
jgi:hypothetical protein